MKSTTAAFATRAIHVGQEPDPSTGAIVPPIHPASTFAQQEIGDYKGYGLSLMVGLLAGALNQAAFGRDVVDFVKEQGKATNTGHAIVALSIDAFAPAALFKRQVDAAARVMRGAERLPGVERIWLPGEQSYRKRQDRTKNGIPVPKPLRESLDAAVRDLAIAPLG